jgi:hypothetical protein
MIAEKEGWMLEETIRAANEGRLAAIECEDLDTGERTVVLCTVERQPDDSVRVLPLAVLLDPDDPTIGLKPPEGAIKEPASEGGAS